MTPTLRILTCFVGLLVPLTASALPESPVRDPESALTQIRADQAAGRLSEHEALMQRFYSVFRPDLLHPSYAERSREDVPACATTLLAELRSHWGELSGTERHRVELASSPLYRGWLQQGGISWEQGDVEAAQAAERATCFEPSEVFSDGGPYGNQHDTDNFSIRYNLGGEVSQTRINNLGNSLEEALQVEHVEMGFYLPNQMFTYPMLVMIERLPSEATGGFTSYAPCGFGGYMAFVVINDQWFADAERLQSVAAHEFFHGIQIEYALPEMWGNPDTPNRWWVEASAVYMETEVYPNLYGSQQSQALRWVLAPWRSLTTYDNSGYQYGTYVFAASMRQQLESTEWFHVLWDQIYDRQGYDLIEEFDVLLADYDSSFEEQWGAFMETAATGEYDFNQWLPGPAELEEVSNGFFDNTTTAEHDADDLPVSESVNSSSNLDRPEYLGVNYVWFDGRGLEDNLGLLIRFEGSGERNGVELAWEVRLVAGEEDEAEITHDLELTMHRDDDGVLDKWTGEILLNDFGEDFEGVFLIVSPTVNFGSNGATWSYEAELTPSQADGSFTQYEAPEDDEDDEDGLACTCSSGSAAHRGGAGALALLVLLLAGLRRDKR
ncbi:MAG: hypothetical protein VX498_10520 [Myxococcota bacterium]|nr:hypothetical protein [Myxococcota bacterium]